MNLRLKPNFYAFFVFLLLKNIIIGFIILGVVLTIIYFIADINTIVFYGLLGLILFASILLLQGIYIYVVYKKTEYIFQKESIICKTGNLFSESVVEIPISKIIAFSEQKPFIEYLLFNSKNILLESAGTQSSSIALIMISEGKANELSVYLQNLLRISFETKPEVYSPSFRGALVDLASVIWQVISSILIYIVFILFTNNANSSGSPLQLLFWISGFYVVFGVINALYRITLSILNIYFTEYYQYKNSLFLRTGILSKIEVFIPKSSLTDAVETQTLFEKILNLQTVVLSIPNNPTYASLFYVKRNLHIDIKKYNRIDTIQNSSNQPEIISKAEPTFRPNPLRFAIDILIEVVILAIFAVLALFYPVLSLFIVPGFAFVLIIFNQMTAVFATKYGISQSEVRRSYNLFTSKTQILSKENITSVKVTRDFFDRILKTATIHFYSFGGSETIQFSYVDYTKELEDFVMDIIDYKEEERQITIYSKIDTTSFLLNTLIESPGKLVLFITGLFYILLLSDGRIIAAYFLISAIAYLILLIDTYLGYKNSRLEATKNFCIHTYGKWRQKIKFVKNRFINKSGLLLYPFSNSGQISLLIAGDISQISGQFSLAELLRGSGPNSIKAPYIKESSRFLEQLQTIIYGKSAGDIINVKKPAYANSIVRACIFPPLVLLLPLKLLQIYFTEYRYLENAYCKNSGIFFKTQEFLFKNKIDHTQKYEDFLNKMFKNESLLLYSSGTESVDMIFQNVRGN